jgi:hypothetical protein
VDGGSGLQFAVGLLVCIGGLRTVAVKKPYLTHGTNRFAEIVGWQLVLTFVGALVVSISDGDKTDSAVDAFLVAVQVGGGLLAVVGAGYEAMGFRQENADALAAVVPVGGGGGGGGVGGGGGGNEIVNEPLARTTRKPVMKILRVISTGSQYLHASADEE